MEPKIKNFNETDYQILTTLLKMNQKSLHNAMFHFVQNFYKPDQIINTKHFIYCKGNIPIMLVAHMDTVFRSPPSEIYYDQKAATLWSPNGLGADDRAGVYAILKILQTGLLPYICLTTEEENGGVGASCFVKRFPYPPKDLKYLIELDRQGMEDCVFYWCDNKEFVKYVEKFEFLFDYGSFSDISVICPAWGLAGVNLSVGYNREHTIAETLNTTVLHSTIKKVCKMLKNPPKNKFKYIMDKTYYLYFSGNYPTEEDYLEEDNNISYQCHKCKKFYDSDNVIPVWSKNNTGYHNYCLNCISTDINWCGLCGNPFEVEYPEQQFCQKCKSQGGKLKIWKK